MKRPSGSRCSSSRSITRPRSRRNHPSRRGRTCTARPSARRSAAIPRHRVRRRTGWTGTAVGATSSSPCLPRFPGRGTGTARSHAPPGGGVAGVLSLVGVGPPEGAKRGGKEGGKETEGGDPTHVRPAEEGGPARVGGGTGRGGGGWDPRGAPPRRTDIES